MSSRRRRQELGLVCMTHSTRCRFRTITRSQYLKLDRSAKVAALESLYWDNLNRLHATLSFCAHHGIGLYRMTSGMFPMSDEPLGEEVLRGFTTLLAGVGRRVERLGIRVVMHPDQFVVLSSDSRSVVRTSIKILCKQAFAMDLMGLPQTAWSTLIVHGGKGGRGRFLVKAIGKLPVEVRSRLSLENDEHAYGAADILDVCEKARVPMVFDNLHHVVHDKLASYDDPSVRRYVEAARATWPKPEWQLVHLSNGLEAFDDARHSHLIAEVPEAYGDVPWIEVEAKGKEEAIFALRNPDFASRPAPRGDEDTPASVARAPRGSGGSGVSAPGGEAVTRVRRTRPPRNPPSGRAP